MLIGGLMTIILGIIGICYSGITILNDINNSKTFWGYNYKPPLTGHEQTIVAIIIISIIIALLGLCLLSSRKKN